MTKYEQWGFKGNPFSVFALEGNEIGSQLFVGRGKELATFLRRLNEEKVITVEGPKGTGKTSLVNVATFRAYTNFLANKSAPIIPCVKRFELNNDATVDSFKMAVYLQIANSLLKYRGVLDGELFKQQDIDTWLNEPYLKQVSVGFNVPAFGMNAGGGRAPTGGQFETVGFPNLVTSWLSSFHERKGKVVCVIDNLEILETSSNAKKVFNALRDELLVMNGVKWVLCGSLGVVRGMASAGSLADFLALPIEIGEKDANIDPRELYESRITTFAVDKNCDEKIPISSRSFVDLYNTFSSNVRRTLSYSDTFCDQFLEFDEKARSDRDKAFSSWLDEECSKKLIAAERTITNAGKNLLAKIADAGGNVARSRYEDLGYPTTQALIEPLRQLTQAGLVDVVQDEDNNTKRFINMTESGWFVIRAINLEKEKPAPHL
jgi:hypothetical protein